MPRLHLPYVEYTLPLRCPNHRFRAAPAGRPCDHRTDFRASWPLRFCWTPHNDKFEKSSARRHIAVTSYDPCTGTVRWSWGQRKVLDCHFGPKMSVDSCDSRKEPARSPYDALAEPIKSYGHRTVILRLPQGDGTMIVRSPCDVSTISRRVFIGYH